MEGAAKNCRSPEGQAQRPGQRLLTACAKVSPSLGQHQEIDELLRTPPDWRSLLATAQTQRIVALCYPVLQESGRTAVPADVLDAFRVHAVATAARNLLLAAKLVELTTCAEAKQIALVPYKGPVLAEMAYGNLSLREFVDLDLILLHRDLHAAWDLLEELGYRPANPALAALGAPVPGEYVFLSTENDAQIELHTELTLRHFPASPVLEPLIAAREPVTLLGQRVLTFSREDTLTLLAVHGAKDFWAQLLWICDIARLVQTPGFDWEKALDRARRMDCRRMVNIALLLASETLAAPLPKEVLDVARNDAQAQAQARWLAGRLFESRAIGRREQIRYRMRMVEGFWPGLRYTARLATTPAADDWKAVRLPPSLRFTYALLRPLRLFRR